MQHHCTVSLTIQFVISQLNYIMCPSVLVNLYEEYWHGVIKSHNFRVNLSVVLLQSVPETNFAYKLFILKHSL